MKKIMLFAMAALMGTAFISCGNNKCSEACDANDSIAVDTLAMDSTLVNPEGPEADSTIVEDVTLAE